MSEKIVNGKILLDYRTYSQWTQDNPSIRKGELIVVEIPMGTNEEGIEQEPCYLIKIGDGEKTFNQLPYISALSADVYDWALSPTKPSYNVSEIENLTNLLDQKQDAGDYLTVNVANETYLGIDDTSSNTNAVNNVPAIDIVRSGIHQPTSFTYDDTGLHFTLTESNFSILNGQLSTESNIYYCINGPLPAMDTSTSPVVGTMQYNNTVDQKQWTLNLYTGDGNIYRNDIQYEYNSAYFYIVCINTLHLRAQILGLYPKTDGIGSSVIKCTATYTSDVPSIETPTGSIVPYKIMPSGNDIIQDGDFLYVNFTSDTSQSLDLRGVMYLIPDISSSTTYYALSSDGTDSLSWNKNTLEITIPGTVLMLFKDDTLTYVNISYKSLSSITLIKNVLGSYSFDNDYITINKSDIRINDLLYCNLDTDLLGADYVSIGMGISITGVTDGTVPVYSADGVLMDGITIKLRKGNHLILFTGDSCIFVGIDYTAYELANNAMPKAGGSFTGTAYAISTNRSAKSLRNAQVQNSAGSPVSTDALIFRRV